ncbi:hypothetical protein ACQR1R_29655 [Bradyrhizobium oligotrophicum]
MIIAGARVAVAPTTSALPAQHAAAIDTIIAVVAAELFGLIRRIRGMGPRRSDVEALLVANRGPHVNSRPFGRRVLALAALTPSGDRI